MGNLEAEIRSLEGLVAGGTLAPFRQSELVENLLMRGQYLGRIADYERADALAEDLVRRHPKDAEGYLARARTRATFHHFGDALADLDVAERKGLPVHSTEATRAAIWQATGRYDDALAVRRRLAEVRPDVLSIGAVATILGDRGEIDAAAALFVTAQDAYSDVSPFPLAWLYVQEGLLWMRAGKPERAQELLGAANDRLPEYAAAAIHLGQVETALARLARDRAAFEDRVPGVRSWNRPTTTEQVGPTAPFGHAIALLRTRAAQSDDPSAAAELARALGESGAATEAATWRARAEARYAELLARHPEAFVDHAAEFWLAAGGDAQKALVLARKNIAVRRTPAAYDLLARAALAAGDRETACEAADRTVAFGHPLPPILEVADRARAACWRAP